MSKINEILRLEQEKVGQIPRTNDQAYILVTERWKTMSVGIGLGHRVSSLIIWARGKWDWEAVIVSKTPETF